MSHPAEKHPARDVLEAFAEGRNSTHVDLTALEQHIAQCDQCTSTIGNLQSPGQLVRRISDAVQDRLTHQDPWSLLDFLEPSPRPGARGRVGQYDVLEVLGQGGFGIVLKAFDDSLQRVVALKVLAPELGVTHSAKERFLREARAAAAIRHDHVVQIYAVAEQPVPHLVMEYIPGETLQQRLARTGRLSVAEVVDLGKQLALGLAAAHQQGLVHRDIKPGNVILDSAVGHRATITDFGLARTVDDASVSSSGTLAGTPLYMAPEQCRGETVDHRSDLFSLASVLYESLTGISPFRAPNSMAVLKRVCDETPRPIREIIPDAPPDLCQLINRLHAKRPKDRIQTAGEVAELLGNGLGGSSPKDHPATRSIHAARRAWIAVGLVVLLVTLSALLSQLNLTGRNLTERSSNANLMTSLAKANVTAATATSATIPSAIISSLPPQKTPEAEPASEDVAPPVVGPPGKALEFDGTSSYVVVPTLSRDDPGPFTFEGWLCPEYQRDAQAVALVTGKSLLQVSKNLDMFFPIESRTRLTRRRLENPIFLPGEWVHLAVVVHHRKLRIYVNGKLRLQMDRGVVPIQTPYEFAGLWLGAHPYPGQSGRMAFFYKGQMDEIRFSNVARYHEEFTPQQWFTSDSATVALYHCDEEAGQELRDASDHQHHGQVVNVKFVPDRSLVTRTVRSLIPADTPEVNSEKQGAATWQVSNRQFIGDKRSGGTSKIFLGKLLPPRFRLLCEARFTGNSGIDVGVLSNGAVLQGYHVELAGTRSGSIGQVIGWKWLSEINTSPGIVGEWMTLQIDVRDTSLTSTINGQQITTIEIPEHQSTELALELDAQAGPSHIEIRKLELIE